MLSSPTIFLVRHTEQVPDDGNQVRLFRIASLFYYLSPKYKTIWLVSRFNHFTKKFRNKKPLRGSNNSQIIKIFSCGYSTNTSYFRVLDDFIYGIFVFFYLVSKAKKDDVIYASWPTSFGPYFAALAASIKRTNFFIEIRDLWPDQVQALWGVNNSIKALASSVMHAFLKIILKKAKIAFVPSEGYKQWVSDLGYSKNIIVSRFTYEESKISEAQFNPSKLLERAKNRKLIVFFGEIGRSFDFECLKKLSSKTKDKFYFACFGSGDLLDSHKKSFEGEDHVDFYGRINASDIALVSKYAKIGFAPYKKLKNFDNHLPNKIVEYLALSLPVIHSIEGEVESFLSKNKCGSYFNLTDVESLENSLNKIFEPRTTCRRLFEENFSKNKIFTELEKLLLNQVI